MRGEASRDPVITSEIQTTIQSVVHGPDQKICSKKSGPHKRLNKSDNYPGISVLDFLLGLVFQLLPFAYQILHQ